MDCLSQRRLWKSWTALYARHEQPSIKLITFSPNLVSRQQRPILAEASGRYEWRKLATESRGRMQS
jgi:hypothetical protein